MKFLAQLFFICAIVFIFSNYAVAQVSVWVGYFGAGMKALEQGKYIEAERMFRAAITEADKTTDPKSTDMMADSLSGLSGALHRQGRYLDAERVTRMELQLREMAGGAAAASNPSYSTTLNNLGLILAEQGKYKEAEEIHRKALILREKYDEPPRRNLATSLLNLGKVYFDQGKYSESEVMFNQARGLLTKIPSTEMTPEDLDFILLCDMNLANVNVVQKKYEEAEMRYKVMILLTTERKGINHPDLIAQLDNYAKLLRITNRPADAAKLDAHIKSIKNEMR